MLRIFEDRRKSLISKDARKSPFYLGLQPVDCTWRFPTIQPAVDMKNRVKEIYRDSIQKLFSKLRSIYQEKNSSRVKKETYNPFRITDLSDKVTELSLYPVNQMLYQITKKPEYKTITRNTYTGNQKNFGLEGKLVA